MVSIHQGVNAKKATVQCSALHYSAPGSLDWLLALVHDRLCIDGPGHISYDAQRSVDAGRWVHGCQASHTYSYTYLPYSGTAIREKSVFVESVKFPSI